MTYNVVLIFLIVPCEVEENTQNEYTDEEIAIVTNILNVPLKCTKGQIMLWLWMITRIGFHNPSFLILNIVLKVKNIIR